MGYGWWPSKITPIVTKESFPKHRKCEQKTLYKGNGLLAVILLNFITKENIVNVACTNLKCL